MVVASRRITNTRTKNWRIILKVWKSNLLEPSMSSVFNPYQYIRNFVDICRHTHTTLITAGFTENKDKTSVLQSSSSSRVHCTFFICLFVFHFAVGKVAMATKSVYCFRHYSSRSIFLEKCPIQLFFIMIVDVGTILFQLKSTVIASIEYIY